MGTYGQFTDAYPPIMDGVGGMVHQYALWLHRQGHRAVVVAPGVPGYVEQDDFQVVRTRSLLLPPKRPYRLQLPALSIRAREALREIPFDLVHAHSPFAAGGMALKEGRRRQIPVVSTFHSKLQDDFYQVVPSRRMAGAATHFIMRHYDKVDAVWTVSEATAGTLRQYGYQGRIEVVPNGSDLKGRPVDRTEAGTYLLQRWQVPPEVPLLLFVGQMAAVKNPGLVVRATAQLNREGSPCHLLMIGEGMMLSSLQKLAAREGMADRVHFTGVLRDREALAMAYRRASLFVFPSLYDNAPLVVREAAAMACPSLLIAGSNAAEGVRHGENGFLSESDGEAVFAAALRDAMSDAERLRRAGVLAEQQLVSSWAEIVTGVEARYQEILREYRQRPSGKRLSQR